MPASAKEARARAEALGLTGAKTALTQEMAADPGRLLIACCVTPVAAFFLYLCFLSAYALLPAALALAGLGYTSPAMRRYFIAFSPRNAFPRNLPAFARWAALYSGAMLVMIALPPALSLETRAAVWLLLAAGVLLFPLIKAQRRARKIWRETDARSAAFAPKS
ncbi:MAG: hypothetical protein AAF841_07585 [Pseudomonadota bacterium]